MEGHLKLLLQSLLQFLKTLTNNFKVQGKHFFIFKMDDAGLYECQVSSTPPLSHHIYLSVAEPYTEIVGGPEIYLDEGSMMNITCLVKDSPEPPNYIFWYHNDKVRRGYGVRNC